MGFLYFIIVRMLFDEIAGQRHSDQDTISKSATNSVETSPTGQFRELEMRRTTLPTLSHYHQIYF